jgi:hypothetical protein
VCSRRLRCFLNWLDKGEMMKIVHVPDHLSAEEKLAIDLNPEPKVN